jgi:ferrochelatase
MPQKIVVANFGGPRDLDEIEPFLISLLTDRDVIRTRMPPFLQKWLFTRIAKKRAKKIVHDYMLIGGKSPIFEDTEFIAQSLNAEAIAFHRYLPATHGQFIDACVGEECLVFPLFPQFSYATTGSIARWFETHLDRRLVNKMRWVKSYASHPAFIDAMQRCIRAFLHEKQLAEHETILLFSAHGLPVSFVKQGDPYEKECSDSFHLIVKAFPDALCRLAYQSRFDRQEWLKPYTQEVCENIASWRQERRHVVFVPLSFTSDHIETLFEVEYQYLPLLRDRGVTAWRCPALNRSPAWIEAIHAILQHADTPNRDLIRQR